MQFSHTLLMKKICYIFAIHLSTISCIHIREFEFRVTILPTQPREILNIFVIAWQKV